MIKDLNHGLRVLTKNPGFTIIAVVSIAIGVGANAAMFSVADGLVFRPLPVPRASEVVSILGQARTAEQAVVQQERTVQQQQAQQPAASSRAQMDPAASPAGTQVIARQTMNGEVTDVNLGTGQVRLTTAEGRVDIQVPQQTARTLRNGDRITIEMVVRSAR